MISTGQLLPTILAGGRYFVHIDRVDLVAFVPQKLRLGLGHRASSGHGSSFHPKLTVVEVEHPCYPKAESLSKTKSQQKSKYTTCIKHFDNSKAPPLDLIMSFQNCATF